jgi:hypothetical protein
MKRLIFLIVVITVSCTGNVKKYNLESKAVYGAHIVLQDDSNYSVYVPYIVYFKRLKDANDLRDGQIISSEIRDSNGNIIINSEPGLYTIIAAEINVYSKRVVVIFDESIMNRMKTELKVGDEKIADKLYVLFYHGYVWGRPSGIQEDIRDQIARTRSFTVYTYRPGIPNPLKYPYILPKDNEDQVIVEFR